MKNIKKRMWSLLAIISVILMVSNYSGITDFTSRRNYKTFDETEMTGMFLEADFLYGEEIDVGDDFDKLIEIHKYFDGGVVYRAQLSDGRYVLVVAKPFFGKFVIDENVRGIFESIDNSEITDKYNVDNHVFFIFERYLTTAGEDYVKPDIKFFLLGMAIFIICICRLLSIIFPKLFPALFKDEPIKSSSKSRDSNFELLRIICMFTIIMQHFAYWGEFDVSGEITANTLILQSIACMGKIGVNCFMMITGYYCAFSEFKLNKITKLLMRVWLYSWVIAIVMFSSGLGIRSYENLIESVFPVLSGAYWFVTIYIVVYILSPYINMIIEKVTKEQYRTLLIVLFVLWSFFPSFAKVGWSFTNTGWLIFMYLVGGYFRKYQDEWNNCKVKAIICYVCSYGILMLLNIFWNSEIGIVVYNQRLAQKHCIPIFVCSVALFVLFKNIQIGSNKFINKIAASTFGVYLIHENPVLNDFLWTEWLSVNTYFGDKNFVVYAFSIILLVYVVCTLIDLAVMVILSVSKNVIKNLKKI